MHHRFTLFLMTVAASMATLASITAVANAAPTFTHGVASGDATSSNAVIWTRLDAAATVQAEVYDNPDLQGSPVFVKKADALASNDFVVQVDASGLSAATTYYYVWRAGTTTSPVGKLKTALAPDKSGDFCFTYTGDSDKYHPGGHQFQVLNAARQEQCDFFVYLGDTIYADSDETESGAPSPAKTLAEYRDRYKVNRDLPNLPNLLASTSIYGIWDDHEVRDDFNRTVDRTLYNNGRQAFENYIPMRTADLPKDKTCAGRPLFRKFQYGTDAEFIIPDQRSCRDAQVEWGVATKCGLDLAPTLPVKQRRILRKRWPILQFVLPEKAEPACLQAINNPKRTMLGPVQKQLFKQSLLSAQKSGVKFKFVISELAWQEFFALPFDRWEGYAGERREILDFIVKNKISNVIFLTTDNHANLVNQVYLQRYPKTGKPVHVADELVTGPIATHTLREEIRSKSADLVEPFEDVLSLVGVECRDTNRYSYGLVKVNSKEGKASVTLKDENGDPIHDTVKPSVPCERTFSG